MPSAKLFQCHLNGTIYLYAYSSGSRTTYTTKYHLDKKKTILEGGGEKELKYP